MPKEVDHDQRREELLEAVWRVIARDGMEGTTIRAIAKETGWSTGVLAHYFGDKDDIISSALRLAYMWARWTVRKGLAVSEEAEVDLERLHCLLDDASRALERHTAIKRFHTQARKSIDQAADQVRDLVGEVHETLEALDAELRG